ncbi:MAG: hypothetical protein ACOYIO_06430 [Eubacteriales bacterium]
MEGAEEGGKELLWMAIKKVCANKRLFVLKKAVFEDSSQSFLQKKSFWFLKMGNFCGQRRKARTKEAFVRKKAALSEVRKAFC